MPTNPNDYPVNLYPVFIDYSAYNLQEITNGYCIDAYPNNRANGTRAIQVASFTDRDRAQQFADFLRNRIGSGDVGFPNTFYQ
jgi:hypothetical protein